MSTKAVIVWLLIAIALGIAAILLLRTPPGGGPLSGGGGGSGGVVAVGQKLLAIQPSDVQRIEILRPDGSREVIERSPGGRSPFGGDSEWQLRLFPASSAQKSADPPAWPIIPVRMQALVRVLAEVRAVAEPAKDAAIGENPTLVRIGLSGSTITLRLAERRLAGTGLVEVQPQPQNNSQSSSTPAPMPAPLLAIVDDSLLNVFNNPGPREWRERAIASGLTPDAARFRLENPRQRLALGRVSGQWSLREPVVAPADAASVQRLATGIGEIVIADFLDSGSPAASTGLENPTARLAVEADLRTVAPGSSAADPTVQTQTLTLTLGGAADASAGRLFASINDSRLVLLDARPLQALTLDPVAYLWPHPTRLSPADVGTLVLDHLDAGAVGKAFKRTTAGWSAIRPDGTEIPLTDTDLREVTALLAFLTGVGIDAKPAAAPQPPASQFSPPEDLRPIGRISLLSLGGQPMETIDVGIGPGGGAVLKSGPVFRTYPVVRLPSLLGTMITAAPPPPASPPAKPEINK